MSSLAESISKSTRFTTLSLFSSVYGIGPNTARRLYALGLRTLDDLEAYYDVDPSEIKDETEFVEIERSAEHQNFPHGGSNDSGKGKSKARGNGESELGDSWIKIALGLREDLGLKYVCLRCCHCYSVRLNHPPAESLETKLRRWVV